MAKCEFCNKKIPEKARGKKFCNKDCYNEWRDLKNPEMPESIAEPNAFLSMRLLK